MASKAKQHKVLRIGIIQDGKIVQERLIKANESVSVGESARNTFVFPKTHLPSAEFKLFGHTSKGYELHFTDKMRGKISSGGAVVALAKLLNDPSVTKKSGVVTLALTEQDRGKISIDSVTVLFQFVAPPPVQAVKAIQAMDFRPRLIEDDDPVFLGFLAIWSALAFVLLIWVWNTEPREFELDELPDRFAKITAPKDLDKDIEEVEEIDPDAEAEAARRRAEEEAKRKREAEEASRAKAKGGEPTEAEIAQAQEDLKQEVLQQSKLLLKIIGTTGESSGGVVENMWSDEEAGLGDIDAALQGVGGVQVDGTPGLRDGTSGRGSASDIGALGGVGGGKGDLGGGISAQVASVSAGTGTVDEDVGDADAARKTVSRYAGQLKYCYESRLKAVPNLEGRIVMAWTVSSGATESIYVVSNTTGDAELAGCIERKIRRWKFTDSVEGDMEWPFVFSAKS